MEDLKTLGIPNWRAIVENRKEWNEDVADKVKSQSVSKKFHIPRVNFIDFICF